MADQDLLITEWEQIPFNPLIASRGETLPTPGAGSITRRLERRYGPMPSSCMWRSHYWQIGDPRQYFDIRYTNTLVELNGSLCVLTAAKLSGTVAAAFDTNYPKSEVIRANRLAIRSIRLLPHSRLFLVTRNHPLFLQPGIAALTALNEIQPDVWIPPKSDPLIIRNASARVYALSLALSRLKFIEPQSLQIPLQMTA